MSWFAVDKEGLAKLLEKRGKAFAIFELIQNAWDTDATKVEVELHPVEGRSLARLVVRDDHPDGFKDLTHAYTLFAESEKKNDPSKRGRFNIGEKLVLAICQHAAVHSTRGTVIFEEDGTRTTKRTKRKEGSEFNALIRMTRAEYKEVLSAVNTLIPPVLTYLNGVDLLMRHPGHEFETSLQTVKADSEGNLTRTKRKTRVEVYEADGKPGWIYELGIPVVETGDKYHVNVMQKVPINLDRDNVPPSYLRTLRAEVLNAMADELTEEEATATWVTDALDSDDVEAEAVEAVVTHRYGEKRAVYDPSDPEANNRLVSQGYTLIHGGAFSKSAWGNVRESGAAKPSGTIAPTPKPYSSDPDADPVDVIEPENYTEGMKYTTDFIEWFAKRLIGTTVDVRIVRRCSHFSACYGNTRMDLSLQVLGHKWFNAFPDNLEGVVDLVIHELGHHYSSNHLSAEYHDALTQLAGKAVRLAVRNPELFE